MLASDVTSSYALYFRYDQNGAPIGFGYSQPVTATPTEYYYLKNLQGDIIGIVDTSGNRVATYSYDAWGNPLSQPTSGVGALNPLRYRGYVYDTETGLYYLQSRYYSPEVCRFISADSEFDPDNLWGYNLFSYCINNPVNNYDPDGHAVIGAIVGGIIGGLLGMAVASATGKSVVAAAIIGGLIGAASGAVCGAFATAVAGGKIAGSLAAGAGALAVGGLSALGNFTGQVLNISAKKKLDVSTSPKDVLNEVDWSSVAKSFIIGAAAGALSVAGGMVVNSAFTTADFAKNIASVIINSEVSIVQGVVEFCNQ